ncbi:CDF family Co(II)/Ni(II) efflux transporter DmeF [Phenylobacterium sp.]|uniref:CDF family Co(II)/Ni(II) efflux transporter DmeF n=1 Tax=Phenylobacterium sp. TaxID=1871053 RepID=UPI0027355059|nr:CDF family Co(II)/Ni(II) efflux transporter DmeF [Phenylobacterium sp.]MDP3855920.1 CDF family Co(II)/Ni(II) efflux transporter DmeF [Phenylobacterium sp.]
MTASTTETQGQIDAFRADRVYLGADHARNERRTWIVAAICLVTLVAQIAGGIAFNSMALVANGLHLAAHVAALVVAAGAYGLARRYAEDPRFSFGTGKLGYLAGFANASVLAVTALYIGFESVSRLLAPAPVAYDGALALAAAALVVNLICMALLRPAHAHAHDRDGDLNLSAAHLHLAADAAVSALAIAGLGLGRMFGWAWADSLAGLAGAALVAHFAWRLLKRAGAVLLDMNPSAELTAEIRARLVTGDERLLDLHLWRLGPGHHAAIAVIEAKTPLTPAAYRARLSGLPGLSHVTVETRDSR